MDKATFFKVIVPAALLPMVVAGLLASVSYAKNKGEGQTTVNAAEAPSGRGDSGNCSYCVKNDTSSVQFVDWSETDPPPPGSAQRFVLDPFQTRCVKKACGAPQYLSIYNASGSIRRTVPVQDNSTYTIRYTP